MAKTCRVLEFKCLFFSATTYFPTMVTRNASTFLDHTLTNSSQKLNQFALVELRISEHDLVYCTKKNTDIGLSLINVIHINLLG